MFGLGTFFKALARLTASINQSADLFDAANVQLAGRLAVGEIDADERPALPAPEADGKRNGRREKATS